MKRIRTAYWRPGTDFLRITADLIGDDCEDGDIIAISEKAISVATGRVVDEVQVRPGLVAKFLARIWNRLIWGYAIGPLCHMKRKTLWRLRHYPIPQGEAHKQVALRYGGFLQALLHYSEAGIDVTNLPYALASLPLRKPEEMAQRVRMAVKKKCGREISVILVDTDKTYSGHAFHITSRPTAVKGIRHLGLAAVVVGRLLHWKPQATPVAISGRGFFAEEALTLADLADKAMGHGTGSTVWDMARRFHVDFAHVTWEMLERVPHYPIVMIREVQ